MKSEADLMNLDEQKAKAGSFRSMHRGVKILVLPNAWDVASARVFEDAGFGAIATTSAGVAFSLGYPDGQKIRRDEMLARIARIAKAVKVPVTADVEAGYGDRPEDAERTTREVIEAGAVGMNLEDSTGDADRPLTDLSRQVERVRAVKAAALKTGVFLLLNARTDVYLAEVGAPETRYDETVRRLVAYRDAGADCVFVPGLRDTDTIGRLVKDVKCPLNILVGPGSPTVSALEKLGVARVSVGSSAMRATLGLVKRIANELRGSGTYSTLEGGIAYADVNKMLQ
jgi:2-methylisocitrate lyase-like PEP mutase family enzyme